MRGPNTKGSLFLVLKARVEFVQHRLVFVVVIEQDWALLSLLHLVARANR